MFSWRGSVVFGVPAVTNSKPSRIPRINLILSDFQCILLHLAAPLQTGTQCKFKLIPTLPTDFRIGGMAPREGIPLASSTGSTSRSWKRSSRAQDNHCARNDFATSVAEQKHALDVATVSIRRHISSWSPWLDEPKKQGVGDAVPFVACCSLERCARIVCYDAERNLGAHCTTVYLRSKFTHHWGNVKRRATLSGESDLQTSTASSKGRTVGTLKYEAPCVDRPLHI